jgi:quercetin dioxygenase-like cupin family protein
MRKVVLDSLEGFSMGPITMQPFAGDNLMIVRATLPAGSIAPRHSHPHEQMTMVVSGRLEMTLGDETAILGPGEVVHIPGGTEHEAKALENAVITDVFHPVREDFLEKIR